jgi:uncharacterized protein
VRLRRWFLPEVPDVLGMLRRQLAVTIEGLEALVDWAGGDAAKADVLRDCEHRADEHKRELRLALTTAFSTSLEPEDIFVLSGGIDDVLNGAKDAVREAEVMGIAPDAPLGEMAGLLLDGVRRLDAAVAQLGSDGGSATREADAAVKCQRRLERVYRQAMGELLAVDDLREVAGRRELYRRFARIGDELVAVAERVWYAVVKEA